LLEADVMMGTRIPGNGQNKEINDNCRCLKHGQSENEEMMPDVTVMLLELDIHEKQSNDQCA
jgi:hypothetical protein